MKRNRTSVFDIVNTLILGFIGITILVPFYNSIMISFLSTKDYENKLRLFPSEITFNAYKMIFLDGWVTSGYRNSLFIVIVGTIYSLTLTTLCAYGFSKAKFFGKSFLMNIFLLTMFFGGGLIPSYLLIKSLGLMDSLWALILPSGMSVFYMLLIRNYFESISESIKESARLDGASEAVILFRIILPLSMPVLATIALFTIVDNWNAWFGAMLYIKTAAKKPLQLCLREIINAQSTRIATILTKDMLTVYGQSVQMAAVVVTMTPIMIVYPFLQKYFVKGIMLGSVKG